MIDASPNGVRIAVDRVGHPGGGAACPRTVGQPRFAPAGATLTSSVAPSPTSPMITRPVSGSTVKRNGLRRPRAQIRSRFGPAPSSNGLPARDAAVPRHAQDLAVVLVEVLRRLALQVIADRDVQVAVGPEMQVAALVPDRGRRGVLPDHQLAGRRGAVAERGEAGDAVAQLRAVRVVGVDVAVGGELRVEHQAEQPALVLRGDARELQERRGGDLAVRPPGRPRSCRRARLINMRPSGVNRTCVGSSRPTITRSLTNVGVGVPGTVTPTPADVVRLPAASRAAAVSVCAPGVAVVVSQLDRVRRRRVLGAERGAVELELHAGDANVIARRGRDVDGCRSPDRPPGRSAARSAAWCRSPWRRSAPPCRSGSRRR